MPTALDELAARIAALEKALRELSRASPLAHSSVDDGALTVTADGKLRAIIGQQGDGTTGINIVNGPVPPTPSAPTAVPALGGVRASWDGTFADGAPSPLDLARVEVHAASVAEFTPGPTTLVTTIDTPQGGIVTVPASSAVWIVLVARSTSGRASAPSDTATAVPAPVVADGVLAGIVDELALADEAITAAKVAVGAINADAIADAAVTAAKLGAAAVEAAALAPGAVTGPAIAAGTVTSREIAAEAITTAELAAGAVNTAKLAAGAVTAAELAAGAVTASKLTSNSVSAGKIAADAVCAGKIAADAITGREIKALSITADKLAVNSITADRLAAGAVTAAVLAADAIDGRTIKGVTITGGTITGGTVQTAQSGRRVLLSPVDPTDNSAAPSTLLYSGAAAERAPARLTGEVQSTPDGSAPTARLTAPQVTTDGAHTPRLLLRSGGPAAGYSARGGFLLDVYGAASAGGQAMIAGYAGSPTDPASVELSVRRTGSSVKTAITHLDPETWSVQLADQIASLYLSSSGLTVKAVLGEVLLQTGTGLRLQGGNVNVGGGLVVGSGTWKGLTFKQGCGQLGGWRTVTMKKMPDGTVALRGIVSVPAGVTSGVIATIDDPELRPAESEVFPAATSNNVNGNVFVQSNGNIELWSASGNLGGWLSFGGIRWSCVD
ncbi:hypothetical protein ACFV4P_02940 [Kitasatospora sp. NPDC059795]|uniref:hypothetical protein n=1 Tax=Kitasatospora sp. NPDC059795 TaxID=3346949 RepID=UPI003646E677